MTDQQRCFASGAKNLSEPHMDEDEINAFRFKNVRIGIERDINEPDWPVPHEFDRPVFGFADPEAQVRLVAASQDTLFELSVDGGNADWDAWKSRFLDQPNIRAFGGVNLTGAHIGKWRSLSHVFPGSGAPISMPRVSRNRAQSGVRLMKVVAE